MWRRDFVKAMVAVPMTARTMLEQQAEAQTAVTPQSSATAPPVTPEPPPATAASPQGLRHQPLGFKPAPMNLVVPDSVAETEARFFDHQQLATLRKLADVMMPPLNGCPGATQAGTAEFLDFLIGVSPADNQEMYQAGLDWLNNESKKQFAKPFAELEEIQVDQLLRPLLKAWMGDHPPQGPVIRFINLAHRDIRMATMNSPLWSVALVASGERAPGIDLYWSPIDPDIEK